MGVQLIVAGGNRAGQVIPISTEKFIIGRAADCHLKPTSELISRYHCAILVDTDVVVRDLGSRNGVRLNGEKINADQKVSNGDRLGIGPLEFFVRISDDKTLAGSSETPHAAWEQPADDAGAHNQPTVLLNHSAELSLGLETK